MSLPDEQRVIVALRAFTGGLTVTDQEIITAESRLRDRLEPPSPRRRLVTLAAAVAAVLVAGFFIAQAIDGREDSAPPADTPSSPAETLTEALQADAYAFSTTEEEFTAGAPVSAQDLAGFWILREPFFAPMFVDADGDWSMGIPQQGWTGTSDLTGDTWTRRFTDNNSCDRAGGVRGFSQPWRAAMATDGSLRLLFTGTENVCTPADDREVWDRVTPGSPVGDYLLAMTKQADWTVAPRSFGWQGLYVAPATGHVFEVAADGKYTYYDSLSEGSLEAADRGELGFDGEASTASCANGAFSGSVEVAQLPGVDGYIGSFDAVRIDTSGSCASGFGSQEVWVNIAR